MKSLELDVERYNVHIKDENMSNEQKELFLKELWNIMISFGDIGWGIDPTQTVCGQYIENNFNRIAANDNALESRQSKIIKQFDNVSEPKGV